MISLVTYFWAFALAAFGVGAATAAFLRRAPESGRLAGWLVWFDLAFVAGLPVAHLSLLPGRPGLWLETGLALFGAFAFGSALGSLLTTRSLRDHEAWAIGLVPLALLWWGANAFAGRALEQHLRSEAASVVERAGGDPALLDVAGRDVLLRGAAGREDLAAQIAKISGVRQVVEVDGPPSGSLAAEPKPAQPRQQSAESTEEPPKAPPADPAPSVSVAVEEKGEASPEAAPAPNAQKLVGDLDAASCQAAISAALAEEPVQFKRNSASIRRASTGVLERVILYLKRCPSAEIEVRAYGVEGERDPPKLARQRAERVVNYLVRMGVERGRLTAVGREQSVLKAADEKVGVELVLRSRG
jgi:outer membrane protein OmpA-like peptidoglycan-associated protein